MLCSQGLFAFRLFSQMLNTHPQGWIFFATYPLNSNLERVKVETRRTFGESVRK